MSIHNDVDESTATRTAPAPYTPRHPVPTVHGYEAYQEERHAADNEPDHGPRPGESKLQTIIESAINHVGLGSAVEERPSHHEELYESYNRNSEQWLSGNHRVDKEDEDNTHSEGNDGKPEDFRKGGSTLETMGNQLDPRTKRRKLKHMKRDTTSREVTDPVTHLPVTIHDSTNNELYKLPENNLPTDRTSRRCSNLNEFSKGAIQMDKERKQNQAEHRGMEKLFPPPSFQAIQWELAKLCTSAMTFGLVSAILITVSMLFLGYKVSLGTTDLKDNTRSIYPSRTYIYPAIILVIWVVLCSGLVFFVRGWLKNRVGDIWEGQVWDAARKDPGNSDSPTPESTEWLNSLLSSVWPLVNPDLFTSLADTLEDVMQASLPKLVRMISVEDLGQGSEAIRILGIRWLSTGAAAKSISVNGKVKSGKRRDDSDRKVPGLGEQDDDIKSKGDRDSKTRKSSISAHEDANDDENIAEGMEAEEGDFVNVEVAFSYRALRGGKSFKVKSKNAHLYLAFYLPGGIRFRKSQHRCLTSTQVAAQFQRMFHILAADNVLQLSGLSSAV